MGAVTITVLHGADRGRVFRDLEPPITIGREDGNTIQLNDERVSRCHLKLQMDNDRLVMTDLDSTNGTKVNGQESHLRLLRCGDLVSVGRSVLLLGTDEEIAERLATLQGRDSEGGATVSLEPGSAGSSSALDFDFGERSVTSLAGTLGLIEPPEVPRDLSPSQAAQVCEILEYLHSRLRTLIETAKVDEGNQNVTLDAAGWQRLVDLQARVSVLLRDISDPQWPMD